MGRRTAAAELAIPADAETVGPFQLIRRIGRGGMGEVWLGRHVVSGTLGAVKRAGPGRPRDRLAGYVAREGRAVLRLDHPHVVPVLELGDDYLVTAYVAGGDLARHLHTPIAPAAALRIVRQIADALTHAHDRGVIHRDIKPSNILIDERGNAYLSDFGLATLIDEPEPPRAGGTPQFMAPEQRRGEACGPSVDQYALGRTLLEMLVGGKVALTPYDALRELPGALPASLRAAIERATAVAPADRFPSIAELADALAAIDLGAHAPPRRLAPFERDAAPFGWLAGAHLTASVGPDLVRADYRLRDLAAAGLLPATEVDPLLTRAGLADLGFAVWGSSARLGPITEPAALARVADVVILLHGWGHTRDVWAGVARGICRDNARALVLTPDVHGFGETTFAATPDADQASLPGLTRALDDWRRLLGVAAIPTAMVGHSMSGLAMLRLDDDRAGVQVTRIAVNPVLPGHDARLRRGFRLQAWVTGTIGRFGPLRRALIRWMAGRLPTDRGLLPESIALMSEQTQRLSAGVIVAMLRALLVTPSRLDKQRRLALTYTLDDPLIDPAALERAVVELGIEPAQVYRLPSGGHHPHVEDAAHPEWSARNLVDLIRIIDAMLVAAGESGESGDSPQAFIETVPAVSTLPG